MTGMTEEERRLLAEALARRIRRLARAACRRRPAHAGPVPPGREPPAGPAKEDP